MSAVAIEAPDPASLDMALDRLSGILVAGVREGASVGFVPPFSDATRILYRDMRGG